MEGYRFPDRLWAALEPNNELDLCPKVCNAPIKEPLFTLPH